MNLLTNFWAQLRGLFDTLLHQPDWHTYIDIAIIAVLIYQVLRIVKQTRANSVIRGVAVILVVTWLSDILQLNTLNWLLQQLISTGVLLIVILFQPEIRRGLEQIGRRRWWAGWLPRFSTSNRSEEQNIAELVTACSRLSKRKVGALIVIERSTGLQDIIESGTVLDAEISAPLIENVFEPNTPLHDGAMVLRSGRIVAAACILQLSEDSSISKDLGTRHRAALGISETTDCISLIVSEETGIISVARDGKLTRYLDEKSLTALLSDILIGDKSEGGLFGLLRRREGAAK